MASPIRSQSSPPTKLSTSSLDTSFFFFNDTATTEIYTLSLHDALPISDRDAGGERLVQQRHPEGHRDGDRKSTRLNSSHRTISYAVFCLKKNKPINLALFHAKKNDTDVAKLDNWRRQ